MLSPISLLALVLLAAASIAVLPAALAADIVSPLPLVVNTWGGAFTQGTDAAYAVLTQRGTSALDAVEAGGARCEAKQCDGTVGFGGSPDEQCETTLDAMIMDGHTMKSGSVAGLRRIKDAISVARMVLEHTTHTMLSGDLATRFAMENGFTPENLTTAQSLENCLNWQKGNCQPNYRINVLPNASTSCGPYLPLPSSHSSFSLSAVSSGSAIGATVESHDTISLIALLRDGSMAAGTTTNGAGHKLPGRVGDGPITGSGSYVDEDVGGCGATGDGDVMMRFLPCYQTVENMRRGMTPGAATAEALCRIYRKYPQSQAAIVALNRTGGHAAASINWGVSYAYRGGDMNVTAQVSVPAMDTSMCTAGVAGTDFISTLEQ